MWESDHKEGWTLKNWCFWNVVPEETPEGLLDCKETKLVNSKGNQSWILIERTDAEAEATVLWPPDGKSWLIGKDPDETLRARKRINRGWDSWMASQTQLTCVWTNSGGEWRTGKPGVLPNSDTIYWPNGNSNTFWGLNYIIKVYCKRCINKDRGKRINVWGAKKDLY